MQDNWSSNAVVPMIRCVRLWTGQDGASHVEIGVPFVTNQTARLR